MQLLVSAANAADARAALEGGADIIDAKEPAAGALGAVDPATLRAIHAAVGSARPLSVALGDAADERAVERDARLAALGGVAFVKFGFAGVRDPRRATDLLTAAVRGVAGGAARVVAVAYADADRVGAPSPNALVDSAARAGAHGVLLDTARKDGPPLLGLHPIDDLARWVCRASEASLLVAVAGRLAIDDLPLIRDLGADVAGVRGAACVGGRGGRVSADLVRALRAVCDAPLPALAAVAAGAGPA